MSAVTPPDPAARAAKAFTACVLAASGVLARARVGRYEPPRRLKRAAQSLVGQDAASSRVLDALAATNESTDPAHVATSSAVLAVAVARALGADRAALVAIAGASLMYDAGRAAIQGADPSRALKDDELDHVPAATVVASTAMGRLHASSRLRTAILYEAWTMRRAHRLGPVYGGHRPASSVARVVALARAFVEVCVARPPGVTSVAETVRLFADHASDDVERDLVAVLTSIVAPLAPAKANAVDAPRRSVPPGAHAPDPTSPRRSVPPGAHAPDPTSPSGQTPAPRARTQGAGFRAPPNAATSSPPPPLSADSSGIKRSAPRGVLAPAPSPSPPAPPVNPIKQSTRRVVVVPRDEEDAPVSARTEEVVFARRPATPAPPPPTAEAPPAPPAPAAEAPPAAASDEPSVDDLLFALDELPQSSAPPAPPVADEPPVSVHDRPTAPPPPPAGDGDGDSEHTRPTAPPPSPKDAAAHSKPTAPPPVSGDSREPARESTAPPRSTEHDDLLAAFLADDPIDGTGGG